MGVTTIELWKQFKKVFDALPPAEPMILVDHGTACIDAPLAKRTPPGTKVRVRLELGGQCVQCRPGVVLHTKGHMGPGFVYVQFDDNVGAWFERDRISTERTS